jgi:Protein of unknown function (DUF3037)
MSDKVSYTYAVLRYVHDVSTGEFVNVGVLMSVPAQRKVLARTRTTIGRIKGVFPDLERPAFTSLMHSVQRAFQKISTDLAKPDLLANADFAWVVGPQVQTNVADKLIFDQIGDLPLMVRTSLPSTDADAATFARRAIPFDDSSLQWGPVGSGATDDAEKTFERLYERLVTRYDTRAPQRRTDEDVWRPVRQRLEERQLDTRLQRKTIRGGVDEIVFRHAWKNGRWQVYEPVSFDLADAEGIKSKAREWLGHLSAVVSDGEAEPFQPHFIVGQPADLALRPAYETAIGILRKAPNQPEVFEEDEVDQLVAQIEDKIRAHG